MGEPGGRLHKGAYNMRSSRLIHLVAAFAVVAGLFVVDVGAAATTGATPERLSNTESVLTKMRCRASAPIVGAVDADQEVTLSTTYPKYVEAGHSFSVRYQSDDTVVPTDQSGIAVINLNSIVLKTRFSGGGTIDSVETVPGTGGNRFTNFLGCILPSASILSGYGTKIIAMISAARAVSTR